MAEFYRKQERARHNTGRLIIYFTLAVIGVALMMSMVAAFFLPFFAGSFYVRHFSSLTGTHQVLTLASFCKSCVCIFPVFVFLILVTSLIRMLILRKGGGAAIARRLGGTLLEPGPAASLKERQLLNVVEEMALAAGIRIPDIYVLEQEDSINAFAAGLSIATAVLGITRGAVELLGRDQLQGVIAHEFGHILNGDMRLNVQLVGILYGLVGPMAFLQPDENEEFEHLSVESRTRLFLYSMGKSGLGGRSSARKSDEQVGNLSLIPLFLFGRAVLYIQFIVGGIGLAFVSLIKGEINKQREFLADASAIQFTRSNEGLAGALKMIGGYSRGSWIRKSSAVEFSHMFIAESSRGFGLKEDFVTSLLLTADTHPPLEERILALEPHWDGIYPVVARPERFRQGEIRKAWLQDGILTVDTGVYAGFVTGAGDTAVETPGLGDASVADSLVPLATLAKGEETAFFIPVLLLYDRTRTALELLKRELSHDLYLQIEPLLEKGIDPAERISLLVASLPALERHDWARRQEYLYLFSSLVRTDHRENWEEWIVTAILNKHLGNETYSISGNAETLRQAVGTVLGEFAYACGESQAKEMFSWATGMLKLKGLSLAQKGGRYLQLEEALHLLDINFSEREKEVLMQVGYKMIIANKEISVAEVELYHVVGCLLGRSVNPLKATAFS